jgi:hypothetical protein
MIHLPLVTLRVVNSRGRRFDSYGLNKIYRKYMGKPAGRMVLVRHGITWRYTIHMSPRPLYMGFVVDKVALGQVSLQLLWVSYVGTRSVDICLRVPYNY